MNIEYKEYLNALKIVKLFKDKVNKDYSDTIIKKKINVKEQVFKMLSIDNSLRTVDIADNLGISKQLVHKYKKEFISNNLK